MRRVLFYFVSFLCRRFSIFFDPKCRSPQKWTQWSNNLRSFQGRTSQSKWNFWRNKDWRFAPSRSALMCVNNSHFIFAECCSLFWKTKFLKSESILLVFYCEKWIVFNKLWLLLLHCFLLFRPKVKNCRFYFLVSFINEKFILKYGQCLLFLSNERPSLEVEHYPIVEGCEIWKLNRTF